ncbi:MAG: hypothetical protein JO071_16955 [Deltaproteobacteria bacterium]|nr:hypothetical protein [Deltaproteobacteria bacterium]
MSLADWHVLFPKGTETTVQMSKSSPGPFPCPSGDIISPFGSFPAPDPSAQRWIRLKGVFYDENVAGSYHVQVQFNMFSGQKVIFDFPQVASGQGASNFGFSNWYKPPIDTSGAHCFVFFVNNTSHDNHAGIYSIIIEAHDIFQAAPPPPPSNPAR